MTCREFRDLSLRAAGSLEATGTELRALVAHVRACGACRAAVEAAAAGFDRSTLTAEQSAFRRRGADLLRARRGDPELED
jgi:hypothetical protein